MKIVRFRIDDLPQYGVIENDTNKVIGLRGDPLFSKAEPNGKIFELDEIRYLSPVIPRSKVVLACNNHKDNPSSQADFIIRPNTTVIGPDDPVVLPKWTEKVHAEPELGVVVKSLVSRVTPEQAEHLIAGYTVLNDFTASDICNADGSPSNLAKAWDTSCPIGPVILVGAKLDNPELSCQINGEKVLSYHLSDLRFSPTELLSQASQYMTLLPGDIVSCGVIGPCPQVSAGMQVRTEISGIGHFDNRILRA